MRHHFSGKRTKAQARVSLMHKAQEMMFAILIYVLQDWEVVSEMPNMRPLM